MKTLAKALAWIYGAYLALALFVVLPALNIAAPRLAQEYIGRELRSELLLFNPFNLSVQARGLSLHETDGHTPLAFRRFIADLSLSSIWEPGIVLDRVWLDDLDLHVLRYADGRFHFDDLLPEADDEAPAEESEPGTLPAFTVRDIRLGATALTYTDRTRPGPYQTVQRDLSLRKRNLTTVPGREGDGRLVLVSDGGGTLSWDGRVDLAASRSAGALRLENIDLSPLWRYEAERLAFVVNDARVDLSLTYTADWSSSPQVVVSGGDFRLHSVDIGARDAQRYPDTYLRLADLRLSDIGVDLAAESVTAELLGVNGLEASGFDENDTVSLADMFTEGLADDASDAGASRDPSSDESGDASPDRNATAAKAETGSGWRVSLNRVSLDDSGIRWATPYLSPDLIEIRPLQISAEDIRWPAEAASRFSLALAINGSTRLDTQATLHLGTGAGDVHAEVSELLLSWFNPLVHPVARTDLARGRLRASSDLVLDAFAPQKGVFDVEVLDFGTVLHETGDEAFSLRRFGLSGGDVNLVDSTLRIGLLELEAPSGSLHIREDGRINVNGVVRGSMNAETSESAAQDETQSSVADAETQNSEGGWRVILERAVLSEGRLDFADDSLPLPFRTMIGEIEAAVSDLDTASEAPLAVSLNGKVDGYAPVTIEGSGTPLGDTPDAQLRLDFRGMDIATMSPYSGTYAGYKIDSGTLSLDLRYALQGQAIDGDNRIVISQMELGEPIESDLAVDVPLKLGLALLTDSRGVIDLAVPVRGNVDDPQFSLGKVIGRAVMNVITKAVTAPFKLLAGLVGSDRDLENIAFAPGSASIDDQAASALTDLAGALTERPQLLLRVGGSADPAADGLALRQARLEQQLLEAGLSADALEARDTAWEAAVQARYALLSVATDADATDASAESEETPAPTAQEMFDRLVETTELGKRALENLGNERAAETKRRLVTQGGVAAERITIRYDFASGDSAVHMEVES